ncbi:MAG: hypothetical protein LBR29_01320 [Methylobacteriaceae bacterium]|nr:hypothetical protein [Methylobacteriaceae bacterium]
MPFISVTTSRNISSEQAERIKTGLGKRISIIPGKSETSLMIHLCGAGTMYFGGEEKPCVHMNVLLFRKADKEAKGKFCEESIAFVAEILDVPVEDVFLTLSEYDSWGSRGTLNHAS